MEYWIEGISLIGIGLSFGEWETTLKSKAADGQFNSGVTGSKYLFSYGDDQVLIDCGLFQGLKESRLRNWAPVPIDLARLPNAAYLQEEEAHYANAGVCFE